MTNTIATRLNLYREIHKGLRHGHGLMLTRLGNTDWRDIQQTQALLEALDAHLLLCERHLKHEDDFIHPALAAFDTALLHKLAGDHEHHEGALGMLSARIASLGSTTDNLRPLLGHQLYLAFTQFVAADFEHMEREEALVMPVLWENMDDAEIGTIHGRIVGAIPPEEMMAYMRLMLPAISPADRLGMLTGIRAGAPAEAFQAILQLAARPSLSAEDFAWLSTELGKAA
ncbi:hemerythrin domain-containing protein [Gimibacter soli]|uniref:Hemerythrin domain-containing protein n=1 Tax=Gimibacter soli TaxID=3024400 RepID=A0AAE9XSN8_9PROT|nr:hemerythrin domain-containing protein [Gimibacter soli]WCL53315.1 hemerythrin domain-containing protein [Gimibacter soli]